jgi:alginate O-acetyltransferase complex protein AlgI
MVFGPSPMPFSSLFFLSCFLPAFLALYWVSPKALKNGVTLAFSLVFYAWGAPRLLPVVLALGVLDYTLGGMVARVRAEERLASGDEAARLNRRARRLLAAAITVHLSVLAYFKYSNFLVAETNALLEHVPGGGHLIWKEVSLPIGISFLTFEEISYLVDVYRGDARPARSLSRYLLFLMLFPHSIAGPIFRWKDLEAQLDEREHSLQVVVDGFARFTLGLAKKVLVADAMAVLVDPVFAAPPENVGMRLAWLASMAYALQIYFDFSGYSDMAIGLGKMGGFRFKENFDTPYLSASVHEFWGRWHISLSTWLRDYLYIPLGGSRRGEQRTRINILIVFALSGLWHGAAWTFVVWGIYHGLLSVAERTSLIRRGRAALPRLANVAVTLVLVTIGWVFFRAPNIATAWHMLQALFGLRVHVEPIAALLPARILPSQNIFVLAIALLVVLAPVLLGSARVNRLGELRTLALVLVPITLVLSIAQLVNGGFSPLIYFKF